GRQCRARAGSVALACADPVGIVNAGVEISASPDLVRPRFFSRLERLAPLKRHRGTPVVKSDGGDIFRSAATLVEPRGRVRLVLNLRPRMV
ncbi:hypothetical protein, partial [Bradyrhizobium sp. NAS96.2]|uniref:hypothetical protein n=1 Tax=Bradyrhizobium sp. NAS96.2 TaxID=1680160 RepID=UPI001AECC090